MEPQAGGVTERRNHGPAKPRSGGTKEGWNHGPAERRSGGTTERRNQERRGQNAAESRGHGSESLVVPEGYARELHRRVGLRVNANRRGRGEKLRNRATGVRGGENALGFGGVGALDGEIRVNVKFVP